MRAMIVAVGLAAASGGCNLVFGLEAPAGGDDDPGDDGGAVDGALDDGALDDDGGDGDAPIPPNDGRFVDALPCQSDTGWDEDGDGVFDDCDGCPHRVDPGQADDDGDGVGNACDPDPVRPNRIAFFDGFNGPGLPGWVQSPATWTQAGGYALQTDGSRLGAYLMRDTVVPDQAEVHAALIAGPFPMTAPDPYRGASVFMHGNTVVVGSAPDGVECQFSTSVNDNSSSLYMQRWSGGVSTFYNSAAVPDLFEVNGRYDVAISYQGSLFTCSGGYDAGAPFASIFAVAGSPPGRALALRTRYTAAQWAYVVVIDRTGTAL